jgi:branched-chain amino acid aminotransferase/4-amino-4-deoxychorismate lyase
MTGAVAHDDRGLTLGVGLFETVLVEAGRPVLWTAHLDRLERGCATLGLPAPGRDLCAREARRAIGAAGLGAARAALRLTWTGGPGARGLADPPSPAPRLLASAAPASPPPRAIGLATAMVRRNPSSPASRLKTLSYLDNVLARRQALAAGADEALMLDVDGRVACAAAANLFWLEDDSLCTPALDCGVLDGTVRALVLRLAPRFGLAMREVLAPPQALFDSGGVFISNSLTGAVPVSRIDGVAVADAAARLAPLLAALHPDALARDWPQDLQQG